MTEDSRKTAGNSGRQGAGEFTEANMVYDMAEDTNTDEGPAEYWTVRLVWVGLLIGLAAFWALVIAGLIAVFE